jgi:hypothetical protein
VFLITIAFVYVAYLARTSNQRAILRTYGDLDAAIGRKDLPAYMALLTPDYTEIRLNQKPRDRAGAEGVYRQLLTDWSGYKAEPVELDDYKEHRDTVNASVKRVGVGNMLDRTGAFGPKNTTHRMKIVTSNLDRWKRSRSGWLLQRRVIALAQVYVDGKLLPGGTVHDDD